MKKNEPKGIEVTKDDMERLEQFEKWERQQNVPPIAPQIEQPVAQKKLTLKDYLLGIIAALILAGAIGVFFAIVVKVYGLLV